MARNTTAAPRLLLALTSGFITSFVLIYASCIGWNEWPLYIFYLFSAFYVTIICRTPSAMGYTIAGSVCATAILNAIKYLDEVLAVFLSIVTIYVVAFITDVIVSTRTKSVVPPRNLGTSYDGIRRQSGRQYFPPQPKATVESRTSPKRNVRTMPLSRKEKKAEKKRERRQSYPRD